MVSSLVDKTPGLVQFDAGPAVDYQQIATTQLQRYKQGLITSRGDPVPTISVLSEPSTPNSSVDEYELARFPVLSASYCIL